MRTLLLMLAFALASLSVVCGVLATEAAGLTALSLLANVVAAAWFATRALNCHAYLTIARKGDRQ